MKYTTFVLAVLLPFYAATAADKTAGQQAFDVRAYCNNAWSMMRVQRPLGYSFAVWLAGIAGLFGCRTMIKNWSAARTLAASKKALVVELLRPYVNFANFQIPSAAVGTAQEMMLGLVINPNNEFLYDETIAAYVKQLMPGATAVQKRPFLDECWELARQKNCIRTDQEEFREEYKRLHTEIREQQTELAESKQEKPLIFHKTEKDHWDFVVSSDTDQKECWNFLLRTPEFWEYEGELTVDFWEEDHRKINNELYKARTQLRLSKEKKLLTKEPQARIIMTRQDHTEKSNYEINFSPCVNQIQLNEANRTIIKNSYHNRHKDLEDEAAKITDTTKAIRDEQIQFVPRPHRPWYLYWFTWLNYGKEIALSRAWFIPTCLKTEEKDKTKKEKIKEQGQFCERMLRQIGFQYKSCNNYSGTLRSAMYEFAWAIDAFKKTEKLHETEKPLFLNRLKGQREICTTAEKRGCDALLYAHKQIARTAKTLIDILVEKMICIDQINKQTVNVQLQKFGVSPIVIAQFFDNKAAT